MTALGVIVCKSHARTCVKKLPVFAADNAAPNFGENCHHYSFRRPLKWWDNPLLIGSDAGRIEGVITENGTPVEGARVSLYYAPTGVIISREVTDVNGEYAFGKNAALPVAIDPLDTTLYYVVAEDPTAVRNAKIADRLTPSL
jgi:hypothetical protein